MAISLYDQFGGARQQAQAGLTATQERIARQPQQQPFNPLRSSAFAMSGAQRREFEDRGQAIQNAQNRVDLQNAQLRINQTDPTRNPFAAFQRIIGTSEDLYNRQSGEDPMDRMLRDQLMARASGQNQPYDARTINALKVGANDQAGAAEMANNQRAQQSLEQRGFKPGDPGYEAAMSRNQLERQRANQQASLGINQQANVANYQAQGQALGQAGGYQTDMFNRQAGAMDRLQRNYNQVTKNNLGNTSMYQIPSYADMMGRR
jgi:hypothetical protein